VLGDEAVELDVVKPRQPVAQLPIPRGLLGAGKFSNGVCHEIRVAVHVEAAAVGELRTIRRIHRHQIQPGRTIFADRGKSLIDDVRHRQYGRPGVELVAADVEASGASAGPVFSFDHGDLTAAPGQMQRRGQAGQTGAYHDHPAAAPRYGPHSVRSVQTAAMLANPARTGSAIRRSSSSVSADETRLLIMSSILCTAPVVTINVRHR